jgi:hypothetical protein
MNTYEQIVRELAETSPVMEVGGIEEHFYSCVFCCRSADETTVTVKEVRIAPLQINLEYEIDHEPACLWLIAKQAVEDAPRYVEVVSGDGDIVIVRRGKRSLNEVRGK